jgi:nucleotide-binding universal stress UspA family protein
VNVLFDLAAIAIGFGGGMSLTLVLLARHERRRAQPQRGTGRRILLPFSGTSISRRSLDAAVRLARAEGATIMPAFLAQVPRQLPLDAPLPNQCLRVMPLLEAIEQRVVAEGVDVDSRVARGRSYRDALSRLIADEPVDRILVSASSRPRSGPNDSDLQWLLQKAPAEIVIVRPDSEDRRTIGPEAVEGLF